MNFLNLVDQFFLFYLIGHWQYGKSLDNDKGKTNRQQKFVKIWVIGEKLVKCQVFKDWISLIGTLVDVSHDYGVLVVWKERVSDVEKYLQELNAA